MTGQVSKFSGFAKRKQLSVAVFCQPRIDILKKNLFALRRQNLSLDFWEPVFWLREKSRTARRLILDCFPSSRLIQPSPSIPFYDMRNRALGLPGPCLYFIDEDVILEDPRHLSRLLELHKKFPQALVLGGAYLNHRDCSFWGRSYNYIVGLWMKNHPGFLPAGNLSIKTGKSFKARFYSSAQGGFGGEETVFLRALQNEGFILSSLPALSVPHLCRHNMRSFFGRAFRHGFAGGLKTAPSSFRLFLKEPGGFHIKLSALCYLVFARVSFLFSRFYNVKPG